jgi:PKD repeat protein
MKNNILLATTIVSMLCFTSCKKYPEACIVSDKSEITLGESIAFSDCSKDAEKKMWDFGDGKTMEGDGHSHTYEKAGTYLVTLKTFSKKDKFSNSASKLITVNPVPVETPLPPPPPPIPPKTRYLNSIKITGYPATKPGGGTWDNAIPIIDPTTEPDIRIKLTIENSTYVLTTSTQNNIKVVDLPYTWDYSPAPLKLTNANWTIKMIDYDAGVAGVGESEEAMAEWAINPTTVTFNNNTILLSTTDGAIIELLIEEK